MTFTRILFTVAVFFSTVFVVAGNGVHIAHATLTNGENAVDLLGQYDQTIFTDPVPVYNKAAANDGPNRFGFNSPKAKLK